MEKTKRHQLLKLIEKDCRLTTQEYAIMLGEEETIVAAEIKRLEEAKVIAGYKALIDWDKVEDDWIEALVEISTLPQGEDGYKKVGDTIRKFPEVESLFFISGGFDFIVLVQGRNIKEISKFISTNLAPIPEVTGTRTHFLLDKYKQWGIDLEDDSTDHRIMVSP
ncbi:Lrp/AsnC family transcriptional regulator [Enterococcus sp. 669A]|uniref:Lrp/AsnC family transcriptional regulator n=1 Tax=Candidatus Enterococcus moelleringii TaxID=2815325 RepID=A0ABS3LB24_9ENTE|nr:Lrp/AsnC family transcriptional regulator [Enterococcus sp. 669A]MBO1305941.1 Lrp/AsnC family transcriptional regulator [Enterococcus sp. 669A]